MPTTVVARIPVSRRLRLIDHVGIFPCPTPNRGAGECVTIVAIFFTPGRAGQRRSQSARRY
jgi:hypothetical protein